MILQIHSLLLIEREVNRSTNQPKTHLDASDVTSIILFVCFDRSIISSFYYWARNSFLLKNEWQAGGRAAGEEIRNLFEKKMKIFAKKRTNN